MAKINAEIAKEIFFHYHGGLTVTTQEGDDELENYFNYFHKISWDDGWLSIEEHYNQILHSFEMPLADDFKITGDGIIIIEEEKEKT
jgi:hypothetical protein